MASLAAGYLLAARLGLRLLVLHDGGLPVWAPSGIALAAFLWLGARAWPAILAGAFLAGLTTTGSVLAALGSAAGNTAEGLLGAWLARKLAGGVHAFGRPRNVLKFAAVAGLVGPAVGASAGVASLALAGLTDGLAPGSLWLSWCLSDAAGALVIAPLLLLWIAPGPPAWDRHRTPEAVLLLGTVVVVGLALFGPLLPPGWRLQPAEFLALPPLLWAAFRFGPREAAGVTVLLSGLAIWGTGHGHGPFAGPPPGALALLQTFTAASAVTTLTVAAAAAARRKAEQALARTAAIVDSSEDAIVGKALDGAILSWNAGAERLYGYRAEEVLGRPVSILAPGQRTDEQAEILERIRRGQRVPPFETRRVRRDGTSVVVSLRVSPVRDAKGEIVGASAIARDVTERRRAERRQAASFAVSRLLSESATVHEAAPRLLKTLCEGLEWSQGELWRAAVESAELCCECRWPGVAGGAASPPPEAGLARRVSRSGEPLWVEDLAEREPALRAGAPAAARGALAWPLRQAGGPGAQPLVGEVAAVLVLYSAEPRAASQELLDLIEDVARRVGQFLEREAHLAGLRRLQQAVETVELGVTITDPAGRIVYTNSAEAAMHGYRVEELIGRHVGVFMPSSWTTTSGRPTEPRNWRRETVNVRRDGSLFPVQLLSNSVTGPDGERIGTVTCCEEITERKRTEDALRASEQRYRLLFERNLAGVYRAALDDRLLECNEAMARLLGYASRDELLACDPAQLFGDVREREASLRQLAASGLLTNLELRRRRQDGSTAWVLENLTLVRGEAQDVVEGTLIDITERKLAEEQTEFQAYHDALTGLPNRRLLEDRLHLALGHARRANRPLALVFLDLDHFKEVNDAWGHAAGDRLLEDVAARLRGCLRQDDTLARLGGDEFVLLLPRVRNAQGAAGIAEKVLRSLERPFVLGERELRVTGSAGIALYPQDGADAQALLERADAAMYRAKQRGRNGYRFCQPTGRVHALRSSP